MAFARLDHRRIIYGTDLPMLLWHGKREWDEHGYHNLCREDFSRNKHKYPQGEAGYTYYLYEQFNNILNVIGATSTGAHCMNASARANSSGSLLPLLTKRVSWN